MKKLVNEVLGELFEELQGVEAKPEGEEEVPPIRFPSWFINENLWGKKVDTGHGSQDRKLITMVGDALSGERTPLGRAQAMQKFLTDTATVKAEGLTTQQALANLMFLDIFASVVHQFNPAVAGFLFEALFAGIFKGVQIEATKGGGEFGTTDVDEMEVATGKKGYSFKLLGLTSNIGGSFSDLINGVSGGAGKETYLVVLKRGESPRIDLTFYEFEINQQTWFDWIGHPLKYETRQFSEVMQFTVADLAEHGNLPVLVGGKPTGDTLKDYVLQAEDGSHYITSSSKRGVSPIHVNSLEGDRLRWSTKGRGNTTLDPNQTYAFETTKGEEKVAAWGSSIGAKLYKDFLPGGPMREWFKEKTRTNEKPDGEYFEAYVANGTYKEDPNFFEYFKVLGSYRAGGKKEDEPEDEEQQMNEAKEKKQKAGQFAITQKYMIAHPLTQGGTDYTLTLDRQLLNDAAKAYTEIISQQVFDIFNSLSDLIKDINTFYLSSDNNERKAGGTKAGTDAESLKTNTDTYIAAPAKEITDEPQITKENTSLNKAVDRVLKEFLQKP